MIFNYKAQTGAIQSKQLLKALDNYTEIELSTETFYIFYPNLIMKLIQNVLWEVFFVFIIVLFPWVMMNASMYYILDSKRYRKVSVLSALGQAAKDLVQFNNRKGQCQLVYTCTFYLVTGVILMLLLADFIFLISNMLVLHDVTNFKDLASKHSKICMLSSDTALVSMIKDRKEIGYVERKEIPECIEQLSDMGTNSFFVSEYNIEAFFKTFPHLNNEFRFSKSEGNIQANQILILNDHAALIDQVYSALDDVVFMVSR